MFDHFYVTGVGSLGYLFIYAPLSFFIVRWFYRKIAGRVVDSRRAGIISITLMVLILGAPIWDINQIGQETKRLCEEKAGLRVYKTVEADGFIGGRSIDIYAKHGYLFTERAGSGDKKYRYTLDEGRVVEEEIHNFSVSHGYLGLGTDEVIGDHHSVHTVAVGDINTQEVYAEFVRVLTYPGWIDNIFIGVTGTGSGFSPWLCGDESPDSGEKKLTISDLIYQTIKPSNKQ